MMKVVFSAMKLVELNENSALEQYEIMDTYLNEITQSEKENKKESELKHID